MLYNYYGTECYATCIKGASNVTIYETGGSGGRNVVCEGEPLVFGCGLMELNGGGYEKFPQFYVNGYNTCHGWDYYNSKVFAICGSLNNDN